MKPERESKEKTNLYKVKDVILRQSYSLRSFADLAPHRKHGFQVISCFRGIQKGVLRSFETWAVVLARHVWDVYVTYTVYSSSWETNETRLLDSNSHLSLEPSKLQMQVEGNQPTFELSSRENQSTFLGYILAKFVLITIQHICFKRYTTYQHTFCIIVLHMTTTILFRRIITPE
jgi:hypothetical protein